MRRITLAIALILLLVACGDGEGTSTTGEETSSTAEATTTEARSTTEVTTTTEAASTTEATATTEAETTTTEAATTTTTEVTTTTDPVTVDPGLPSAESRSLIPWSDVGTGWHVALYDASDVDPITDGPVVLYLVSPDGTRYEAASWAPDDRPWELHDVRPDGTAAIVVGMDPVSHDTVWELVNLTSGSKQVVHTAGFPENTYSRGPEVKFTRPTGTNLVVYRSDGTDEWIERHSTSGTTLATVYTQDRIDGESLLSLYGQSGVTILVKHHGGIAYIQNDGTLINEVWIPMDHDCDPVKWWDSDTFLAACRGGPASAPHEWYHQLWLLETDGTAGSALTSIPTGSVDVVDFGYVSAYQAGSDTLLQWAGDCSAGAAFVLQPDGSGVLLSMPWFSGEGYRITDVVSGQMGVYSWAACGEEDGALAAASPGGAFLHQLVPLIADTRGVIAVLPVGP